MIQSKLSEQNQIITLLLKDLQKKSGDWLWETDENGIITSISDKLCRILTKQPDELIGLHCFQVLTDTFANVEKLIEDKQHAEMANQMKSQFLANVSHEIRTPLNAMFGFFQLLSQTNISDTQNNYLRKLEEASNNLLYIINDILDFSKIEQGKIALEEADFDLRKVISDSVSLFKPSSVMKGVSMTLLIDDTIPEYVSGDSIRLSQILNNLLSNAVKFTQQGSITISARKTSENDTSYTVEWIVKDTGIGMDDDTINRLFQPFMQADSSTTRIYGGTGLGLAIAYNLVNMMGGTLSVESQPKQGSSFYVNLDLKKCRNKPLTAYTPQPKQTAILEKAIKILLVEDNSLNTMFITTALKSLNVSYETATNGEIAANMATSNSYDMILMDCQMPIMDGYTATSLIRKRDRRVPIVALTANLSQEDKEKCLLCGMDDYISKPVYLEELKHKILKYTAYPKGYPENKTDTPTIYERSVILLANELNFSSKEARELLDAFVFTIPAFIEKLDWASNNTDYHQMSILAHQMKGVSCNLRLPELQEICSRLETAAKEKNGTVKNEVMLLKTVLKDFLVAKEATI